MAIINGIRHLINPRFRQIFLEVVLTRWESKGPRVFMGQWTASLSGKCLPDWVLLDGDTGLHKAPSCWLPAISDGLPWCLLGLAEANEPVFLGRLPPQLTAEQKFLPRTLTSVLCNQEATFQTVWKRALGHGKLDHCRNCFVWLTALFFPLSSQPFCWFREDSVRTLQRAFFVVSQTNPPSVPPLSLPTRAYLVSPMYSRFCLVWPNPYSFSFDVKNTSIYQNRREKVVLLSLM